MSDADSEPSVQEVRVIALVSVLDLDNIFVSIAICPTGRGNSLVNARIGHECPQHPAEINHLLAAIIMLIFCISLNDVN